MLATTFSEVSSSRRTSLTIASVWTKWIFVFNLSSHSGPIGIVFISTISLSPLSVLRGTSFSIKSVGAGWNWISDLRIFFTIGALCRSSFFDETGSSTSFFGWSTPVGNSTSVFFIGFSWPRAISDLNLFSVSFNWISSSDSIVWLPCSTGAGWNWISVLRIFFTIGAFGRSPTSRIVTSFLCSTGNLSGSFEISAFLVVLKWTFSTGCGTFSSLTADRIVFLLSTISLSPLSVLWGTSLSIKSVGAGWNWISDLRIFFTIGAFGLSSLLEATGNSSSFFVWFSPTPVGSCASVFPISWSWQRGISFSMIAFSGSFFDEISVIWASSTCWGNLMTSSSGFSTGEIISTIRLSILREAVDRSTVSFGISSTGTATISVVFSIDFFSTDGFFFLFISKPAVERSVSSGCSFKGVTAASTNSVGMFSNWISSLKVSGCSATISFATDFETTRFFFKGTDASLVFICSNSKSSRLMATGLTTRGLSWAISTSLDSSGTLGFRTGFSVTFSTSNVASSLFGTFLAFFRGFWASSGISTSTFLVGSCWMCSSIEICISGVSTCLTVTFSSFNGVVFLVPLTSFSWGRSSVFSCNCSGDSISTSAKTVTCLRTSSFSFPGMAFVTILLCFNWTVSLPALGSSSTWTLSLNSTSSNESFVLVAFSLIVTISCSSAGRSTVCGTWTTDRILFLLRFWISIFSSDKSVVVESSLSSSGEDPDSTSLVSSTVDLPLPLRDFLRLVFFKATGSSFVSVVGAGPWNSVTNVFSIGAFSMKDTTWKELSSSDEESDSMSILISAVFLLIFRRDVDLLKLLTIGSSFSSNVVIFDSSFSDVELDWMSIVFSTSDFVRLGLLTSRFVSSFSVCSTSKRTSSKVASDGVTKLVGVGWVSVLNSSGVSFVTATGRLGFFTKDSASRGTCGRVSSVGAGW